MLLALINQRVQSVRIVLSKPTVNVFVLLNVRLHFL